MNQDQQGAVKVKGRKRKAFLSTAWHWPALFFLILAPWAFYYFYFFRVFKEIDLSRDYYYSIVKDKKDIDHVDYKLVKAKTPKWARLSTLPRYVAKAFVVSEDSYFYQHPGYDLEAMKLAFKDAMAGDKKLRGASTINQQLAKNLFLSRDKTLWRKALELVYAIYMNQALSKNRIMELYLNIIEFGPGVWGIGEASRYYFKKSPTQLTPKEVAFLAMLLPNPKKYSQSFRDGQLSPFARKSVQRVLRKLTVTGDISKQRYFDELARPLSFERSLAADHEEFLRKAQEEIGPIEDEEALWEELGRLEKNEVEWAKPPDNDWPKEEWAQ